MAFEYQEFRGSELRIAKYRFRAGREFEVTPELAGGASVDAPAVRAQLGRIVASVPFRNSKRYPAFLQYVVEQELKGAASELKERTIAIDVFGRDPYYDPAADPVVRITAGEVRKRLAQYYQDVAQANEVRIELPLGSYRPEFVFPVPLPAAPPLVASDAASPYTETGQPNKPQKLRKRLVLLAAACAVVGLLIGFVASHLSRPTALDLFWRPVIKQSNSVLLCLGSSGKVRTDVAGSSQPASTDIGTVAWWDAETLARLAGLLGAKGASLRLFTEDEANFSDFQQSPAVLIGAYNDPWTLELMSRMRFTFQRAEGIHYIADRDHPAFRGWKVDLSQKDADGNLLVRQDYAIISRVSNPRTGFITVTVAGLWGNGTVAAGQFLTDPKYLDELVKRTGLKLDKGAIQIVIGTEVIQGKSGPPTVLAVASW
jgi:hypothetical protein